LKGGVTGCKFQGQALNPKKKFSNDLKSAVYMMNGCASGRTTMEEGIQLVAERLNWKRLMLLVA